MTLYSRPPEGRRAVRNEPELIAYIQHTWDVEIESTTFNVSLWEAIDRMRRTAVFVGMHVRQNPNKPQTCRT